MTPEHRAYRRVLVPLDGSRFSEAALPRGLALAAGGKGEVDLVTVANVPFTGASDFPQEEIRERTRRHAERYLETLAGRIRDTGFEGRIHTRVVPAGNVPRSLVWHAEEGGADLAVMTTHGRGPVERAWLGSSADGFIRRSPIPVLLLRPDEGQGPVRLDTAPDPFARVLLPLDGSEEGASVLRAVGPLIAGSGVTVVLLRVVLDPSFPGGSPYVPHLARDAGQRREIETGAREYLDRIAERTRTDHPDVSIEQRVVTAPRVAPAILDSIRDEKADLVALATSGRGGAARLVLGSVADKVIRSAPVPVFLSRGPAAAG